MKLIKVFFSFLIVWVLNSCTHTSSLKKENPSFLVEKFRASQQLKKQALNSFFSKIKFSYYGEQTLHFWTYLFVGSHNEIRLEVRDPLGALVTLLVQNNKIFYVKDKTQLLKFTEGGKAYLKKWLGLSFTLEQLIDLALGRLEVPKDSKLVWADEEGVLTTEIQDRLFKIEAERLVFKQATSKDGTIQWSSYYQDKKIYLAKYVDILSSKHKVAIEFEKIEFPKSFDKKIFVIE